MVLDADLSKSTTTAKFGKKFPERFFNMGVAEANMMNTAARVGDMRENCLCEQFQYLCHG